MYPLHEITVSTLLAEDIEWSVSQSCKISNSNIVTVQDCDLILLLVRPEVIKEVLCEIREYITEKHLIVSVAAGVKISKIESFLPSGSKVCRIMINLQIQSCVGTSAVARGSYCTDEDASFMQKFMSSLGYCIELPESNFDAFTALSGSGPAFIYGVIEALAEGATLQGIPRKYSIEIATHMVRGSAIHALENLEKYHPCQLREAVCTPGGSSIQGMRALENAAFRAAFISAIDAAVKKNQELGNQN
ncbi:hypothetical protein HZS_2726 [Henneguya salminicola]|nr:hypothetical protein HZS_2726 [Henneguya salminicola]